MNDFEYIESDENVEVVGVRKLPWPIDILLYPVSVSGIANIFVITFGPIVVSILPFGGLIGCIFSLYACWYLAECVKDSAAGEIRASSVMASSDDDLGGMFWSWVNIFGCYLVCFGPAAGYSLMTERQDITYWIILASGTFVFPMFFLAVTLFDSNSAWNPFRLIVSIIKTFPQYLLLTGCLMGVILVFHILPVASGGFIVPIIAQIVILYVFLIYAHLIGRLFFKNQDRLDWF